MAMTKQITITKRDRERESESKKDVIIMQHVHFPVTKRFSGTQDKQINN